MAVSQMTSREVYPEQKGEHSCHRKLYIGVERESLEKCKRGVKI